MKYLYIRQICNKTLKHFEIGDKLLGSSHVIVGSNILTLILFKVQGTARFLHSDITFTQMEIFTTP